MDPFDFELIDDFTPTVTHVEPIRRLREYQDDATGKIEDALKEYRTVLAVMATGTGKTVLFSHLTKSYVASGGKVLILAHADELIEQARDKLTRATGIEAAKEKAAEHATTFDQVVCASVQTLRGNRLRTWRPDHFDLIIIDEAHRSGAAGYQAIIKYFTGKILGVTATPSRGDKKSLLKWYDVIACNYGLIDAVKDGWLVRPLVQTMPLEIDIRGVKKRAGDLSQEQVSHRLVPYLEKIAAEIRKEAASRKILIFLPSIETAKLMSEELKKVGFDAEFVSGECKDRNEKIADYKSGKIQVLCNAMLLTEGFDDDAIDCIVCLRPTQLIGLYMQIIGRGTRPLTSLVQSLNEQPDPARRRDLIAKSAKPFLMILDFLWLYESHNIAAPADIVAPNEDVSARMQRKSGDLLELEKEAEGELFDALQKALDDAAKRKSRKKQLIDPLAISVILGDKVLADYEARTKSDALPISDPQKKILKQQGIALEKVEDRGHASAIISRIFDRRAQGKCSLRQMNFLKRLHIDAMDMPEKQARKIITSKLNSWRERSQSKLPLHG